MRILLLFCVFFVSCRPTTVTEDELVYQHGIMVLKKSQEPFTGDLIARRKSGRTSYKFSYENGVAKGNWYTKGYEGEIIQEGVYIDCDPDLVDFIKKETGSDSCSLDLWTEAPVTFVTLGVKSSVALNDTAFALVYSKYLKKYQREYTEIKIYDGDSILASRTFP